MSVVAALMMLGLMNGMIGEGLPQEGGLFVSDVCRQETRTGCDQHRLSCSPGTTIFLVDISEDILAENESACVSRMCETDCCQRAKFNARVDAPDKLPVYFPICWRQPFCVVSAGMDRASSLSSINYRCVSDFSIRSFADPADVTGSTVVARYNLGPEGDVQDPSCTKYPASLGCHVHANTDGPLLATVEVTIHHSNNSCSPCPHIDLQAPNYDSDSFSLTCNYDVERKTLYDVETPFHLSINLTEENKSLQVWAVVQVQSGAVQMSCGMGTCFRSETSFKTRPKPETKTSGSDGLPVCKVFFTAGIVILTSLHQIYQ